MNYLADTHILIWAITDSPKLSKNAREILLSENNNIYLKFNLPNFLDFSRLFCFL